MNEFMSRAAMGLVFVGLAMGLIHVGQAVWAILPAAAGVCLLAMTLRDALRRNY